MLIQVITLNNKSNLRTNKKRIGFWKCWSISVGVMIGSGVFLLPSVLAPFGSVSFLGWLVTGSAAILISLILGRLSSRTNRSGGFYVYTQDAFGDLPAFLIAWGYWLAIVFSITAISTAFVGYLGSIIPQIRSSSLTQAFTASALIWTFAAINIRSLNSGAKTQLVTVILKLTPLIVIIFLGFVSGSVNNIPEFNPQGKSIFGAIASTALLTMWAFIGLEAGTVAAADISNPKKTIPKAILAGTITVTLVYIFATASVMMLVPIEVLQYSEAPFLDAASPLGWFGGILITFGVLISTAGSVNGNILLSGQMPMALAIDGLAPKIFSKKNRGGSPSVSIIFSCIVSSLLLILNYQEGLINAFVFLISMSTLCTLLPYAISAMAEIKASKKSSNLWISLSLLSLAYICIAMFGSGLKVLLWGLALIVAGLPIYYLNGKYR